MSTQSRLSRAAVVICFIAVLFAAACIYSAISMRDAAQSMYDHPYTVTNTARAMRSRLLDMKRFVNIFLTTSFESEAEARALFLERYELQNEAIESIGEAYLGPGEDVALLKRAMDDLIASQDEALRFVGAQHNGQEIEAYINERVYPYYDAVNERLETIISSSDARIYALTKHLTRTAEISIGTALLLAAGIIFLTVYSNGVERRRVKDLKAREQALEDALLLAQQANNAKKDFLSRMSHEIRTPMNAIIGMTTIAGAHLEERGRLEDCLAKIAFSSRHLLALINDVLDMSKIEAGKLTVNLEPFRLHQLVEAVVPTTYAQARAQGKTFICDAAQVEQEVFCSDFLRINQILLNLLSNAVKFTPPGGEIRLIIRQLTKGQRTLLQFEVADTGIGMSEDFLERLFLPFEQAGGEIAQRYGGTGLGMAITHNLVELLGGHIAVQSKLGCGTTFIVDLPVEPIAESGEPRQLDTLKVLVVDDEEEACQHAGILLERMGIAAQCASTGREAIDAVLSAQASGAGFDVCLVDWRLPDMDGVMVARQIRQGLGPFAVIIIISAYDWSDIEAQARQAGVNAFIAKPFFASTLYNVLSSVTTQKPPAQPAKAQLKGLTGVRILLAEDNALNREIAAELLEMMGAETVWAANGQEAVDLLEASSCGHFDAVLMDVQMPVLDGCGAARQMRASSHPDGQAIPIIAMTANTFAEDIDACYAAGMNGHIAKPVDIVTLYETLAGILQNDQSNLGEYT